MVSIFAKARICRGNTQVHLQFFCKSKLQSTQKGRAATQMDRSSTSSEISFHGLPSKSKRPSIRKHSVVVIITVNSISFYETAICREIFNFQKIVAAHQNTFRKVLESSQKTPMAKSYFSKVAGFYRSNHRMHSVFRKVLAKFTGKGLCQRL